MGRDAVRTLRLVGLLVAIAALLIPSAAMAAKKPAKKANTGFVFSQSNNPGANSVYVFKRNRTTGKLSLFQAIRTGGKGTAGQQPFGLPVVDSADSIILSPSHKLLFVVNDGDNT